MTDFLRPTLTLIIDRNLYRQTAGGKGNPLSLVEAAVSGGVDTIQLRVNRADKDDLGLFAVAMRVRELTQGSALFVMTSELELAERCHADGVLLPERSYKPSEARGYLRGNVRQVGAFVQSVNGASRAERGGADYVQVGPAFPESEEMLGGMILIRKIKDAVQIPVIAFGGIMTASQVGECIQAGADGIAVTEAITKAPDPAAAAASMKAALEAAWQSVHGGA